jgi:hypothetical protein
MTVLSVSLSPWDKCGQALGQTSKRLYKVKSFVAQARPRPCPLGQSLRLRLMSLGQRLALPITCWISPGSRLSFSRDAVNRLDTGHRRDSPWFRLIARMLIEEFPTQIEARQAETTAIWVEEPLYNDRTNLRTPIGAPPRAPVLQPTGQGKILACHHGTIEIEEVVAVTIPADPFPIEALREQLGIANRRIDELQAALGDERRRMIAILTDDRRRPWWRRWFR